MAATARSMPFVPVSDYLGHDFEPDVDYVDGVLEERILGELDHSLLQRAFLFALLEFEKPLNAMALVEIRVQVGPTRYRVPDVCLVPASSKTPVVQVPPFLCVEVLSPEDRLPRMRMRCADYIAMGVPAVWIVDPETRSVFVLDETGFRQFDKESLPLPNHAGNVDLAKIFAILDR